MRKIFILILCTIGYFAFADDEPIFLDIIGSHAIYHDQRFNNDTFIGICYAGENTILARSYETNTQTELLMLIPFIRTETGIDIDKKLAVIKGSLNANESSSRLLPMIMNWANTWYKVKNEIEKNEIEKNDTFFASTDDYFHYVSWIPVFQIQIIGKKEEFSIVTVGRLQDNHDPRFFSFTELPNPINADSYSIQNGQMQDIVIDGLKISLDDNWKTEDNRVYRISNKTPQDSIFFIETFNYKQSGFTSVKQLAKILLISNQGVMLLTDGSDIFYKDGNYNIVMRMLDQYQNKVTIQQTQIIERDEEHISLATLACYETLYLDNKQFFDSIIY